MTDMQANGTMALPREKVVFDSGPIMRLANNDVNTDQDGGRIILEGQNERMRRRQHIGLVTFMIGYLRDEVMGIWPVSREERQNRRFRVLIVEEEPLPDEDF